ncbi:MAG: DegV family protein [Oscillospiraceae bacterium]|nr:DegV family protein [Oscillospiraceae bacterium]
MSQFTIMIDTGCDLPETFIKENNLSIIPVPFNLDGKEHVGGRWQEISDKQFYDALRNGGKAGTTLINPEAFTEVFTEYAKKGEALLHISLSSGLSGTYQNALLALNDVKEAYPDCQIRSVDSLNAAPGIGLVTVLAIKKRNEGATLDETADYLEAQRNKCFSLFTVDDLMFLHRGGRVSKFSAIAGSIIGVKPVLNVCPDGTLKLKDKARGRKGSLEMLVNQMKRSLSPDTKRLGTVLIGHGDCEADAQTVANMIKADYDVEDIKIVLIGPVIGAHSGPGTIALFFEADMTRTEYEAKFYPAK